MVFVDSNVPMYLIGTPHPNRDRLEQFLRGHPDEVLVTSAEVYQEIIHRYVAIDRPGAIADGFALLDDLVTETYPIARVDAEVAAQIAGKRLGLSGRDCLHLAVMARHGVSRILTLDAGFDAYPGVTRLPA